MTEIDFSPPTVETAPPREGPLDDAGVRLNNPANSHEAVVQAGLDWTTEWRQLYYRDTDSWVQAGKNKIFVRLDPETDKVNASYLVAVSRGMSVQNVDMFTPLDKALRDHQAIYHTGGSCRKGMAVWLLVRFPGESVIVPGDVVQPYLAMIGLKARRHVIRLVLMPVRRASMGHLPAVFKERPLADVPGHLRNMWCKGRPGHQSRRAGCVVRRMLSAYDESVQLYRAMATVELTMDEVIELTDSIGRALRLRRTKGPRPGKPRIASTLTLVRRLPGLWEDGRGNRLDGVRGTAWALLAAAAEWVSSPDRGTNTKPAEVRLWNTWFGKISCVMPVVLEHIIKLMKKRGMLHRPKKKGE